MRFPDIEAIDPDCRPPAFGTGHGNDELAASYPFRIPVIKGHKTLERAGFELGCLDSTVGVGRRMLGYPRPDMSGLAWNAPKAVTVHHIPRRARDSETGKGMDTWIKLHSLGAPRKADCSECFSGVCSGSGPRLAVVRADRLGACCQQ